MLKTKPEGVVTICGRRGWEDVFGTGFYITSHHVMTCAHVVETSRKWAVREDMATYKVLSEAILVYKNVDLDYAILAVNGPPNSNPLALASAEEAFQPKLGNKYTLVCPYFKPVYFDLNVIFNSQMYDGEEEELYNNSYLMELDNKKGELKGGTSGSPVMLLEPTGCYVVGLHWATGQPHSKKKEKHIRSFSVDIQAIKRDMLKHKKQLGWA